MGKSAGKSRGDEADSGVSLDDTGLLFGLSVSGENERGINGCFPCDEVRFPDDEVTVDGGESGIEHGGGGKVVFSRLRELKSSGLGKADL